MCVARAQQFRNPDKNTTTTARKLTIEFEGSEQTHHSFAVEQELLVKSNRSPLDTTELAEHVVFHGMEYSFPKTQEVRFNAQWVQKAIPNAMKKLQTNAPLLD